jgi:pSer/pThr/pTyr-binding forkhead associated (FHA) protein
MFTQPAPSPPTLATTTSPSSTASPTRPSRLRGLSYLRNYTHNHLHSRESSSDSSSPRRYSLTRSTSYPAPTSTHRDPTSSTPPLRSPIERSTTNTADHSTYTSEPPGNTTGWLPTVGGQSGASRTGAQPQSTSTGPSSAVVYENNVVDSGLPVTMGRTRSATMSKVTGAETAPSNGGGNPPPRIGSVPLSQSTGDMASPGPENGHNQLPSIRFSQHQDARAPRPSLVFGPMSRTLPSGKETIRVGRYSERENAPNVAPNIPSAAPVGFKSKVVSRRHCEFWFQDGAWFIKDVKSSSGTFLNHVRLSQPGTESKPYPVKDGDIVQLGIDFKGGEEMIFRCVKIRIELNKGWQHALNSFKSVFVLRYLNLLLLIF